MILLMVLSLPISVGKSLRRFRRHAPALRLPELTRASVRNLQSHILASRFPDHHQYGVSETSASRCTLLVELKSFAALATSLSASASTRFTSDRVQYLPCTSV